MTDRSPTPELRTPEPRGLTTVEAASRLARHGANALPEAAPEPLWRRLGRQLASPLIYVLLFALALDLGLWWHAGGHEWPTEAIAIGFILVLNACLGAWQESKADRALARLKTMAVAAVWAMRDGVLVQVPASDIVPGDLVRVESGDRVPADGVLVAGDQVLADEAVLTGESLPVEKPLQALLLSGTLLVRGKGYMHVDATGPDSSMGRLATLLGSIEAGRTPLERRLAQFGNQVAIGMLLVGLALTVGGIVVEGVQRIGPVVLFSVALAVAAVPEALPAVLTLTLALGVERLARARAIVRRLSAVEALGSVTVIATDKTGTLTENRMHVAAVDAVDAHRLLTAMVLANDAEIATKAGDPLEIALIEHAAAQGLDAGDVQARSPRIASRPFDSAVKMMSVTVGDGGATVTYVKGAPEVIIARCDLDAAARGRWEAKAEARAAEGYRVLALAMGTARAETGKAAHEATGLELLGLVMLWDPVRPEVPDAIRRAGAAGIRVVMITGDHPATAKAVAASVGIERGRAVTGDEMRDMPPAEFARAAATCNVFARVLPEQKLQLVELLQAAGDIVAVTGDGVNDAPALKRADVGIAMGRRGSDVAREVADIVLVDDNFATIVRAIEEGRSIYANVQSFIRFFFSTDLALILLMAMGLALAFRLGLEDPTTGTFLLPLTAAQLLWINVVADGPPALAMALDRNRDVMDQPPRPPTSRLLDAQSIRFIVLSGATKAVVGVGFLAVLPLLAYPLGETRTAVFLYESLLQLVYAYPSRRAGGRPLPNAWLHVAVGLGALLQLATVLIAPLRTLLGLVPLHHEVMAAIIVAVLVTWAAAECLWRFAAPIGRPGMTGAASGTVRR